MSDRQASQQPIAVSAIGAVQYDSTLLLELLRDRQDIHLIEPSELEPLKDLLEHGSTEPVDYARLDARDPERLAILLANLDIEALAKRCDLLFLALPNGSALSLAPQAIEHQCRVIDLSADFRLRDFDTYRTWYRTGQTRTSLPPPERTLGDRRIAYGLPELFRDAISQADVVACPGCVATASLLALAPLLRQGLIDPDRIAIDVKTCFPSTATLLSNSPGNLIEAFAAPPPAGISTETLAQHPQIPEIEQVSSDIVGRMVQVHLNTYAVPVPGGLLASLYSPLRDPGLVNEDLLTIYRAFYKQSPWVDVVGGKAIDTAHTLGTNRAAVGLSLDVRTNFLTVLVAIDERLRGRVGQAIHCLNLLLGCSEKEGLPHLP